MACSRASNEGDCLAAAGMEPVVAVVDVDEGAASGSGTCCSCSKRRSRPPCGCCSADSDAPPAMLIVSSRCRPSVGATSGAPAADAPRRVSAMFTSRSCWPVLPGLDRVIGLLRSLPTLICSRILALPRCFEGEEPTRRLTRRASRSSVVSPSSVAGVGAAAAGSGESVPGIVKYSESGEQTSGGELAGFLCGEVSPSREDCCGDVNMSVAGWISPGERPVPPDGPDPDLRALRGSLAGVFRLR